MIPNTIFPIEYGQEVFVAYVVWFLLLYVLLPTLRYVVGLRHWRYSTVLMLALSLWLFLLNFRRFYLGLGVWLVFFIVGLAAGVTMFSYLQDKRLNYFVKVSLVNFAVLMGVALGLWSLYFVTGLSMLISTYSAISIILLFSSLYEYVLLYSRRGSIEFIRRGVLTLLLAVVWGSVPVLGFGLAPLFRVHLLIIGFAFVLLLVWIARWKHLTFLEYFRFKSILSKDKD